MLLSKERYIARIFSVMLGYDIAEKLYALNEKLFIKSGVRLDIRLPSLYHVLAPSPPGSEGGSGSGAAKEQGTLGEPQRQGESEVEDPAPGNQKSPQPPQQGPRKTPPTEPQVLPQASQYEHSDMELPSGEDSTSLVLEDFGDVAGSLMDYGSERDYLR